MDELTANKAKAIYVGVLDGFERQGLIPSCDELIEQMKKEKKRTGNAMLALETQLEASSQSNAADFQSANDFTHYKSQQEKELLQRKRLQENLQSAQGRHIGQDCPPLRNHSLHTVPPQRHFEQHHALARQSAARKITGNQFSSYKKDGLRSILFNFTRQLFNTFIYRYPLKIRI